jgi:hypothetical protein
VPRVTKPKVTGAARQGEVLVAAATWKGDPAPTVVWAWQRCNAQGLKCAAIAGADSARYTVAAADIGRTLRAKLVATNSAGSDAARSEPTAPVEAAAPPPPAYPTPSPEPAHHSTSSSGAPFHSAGPPAPPPVLSGPALLRPFPIVRLRGTLTATGARITLFTVRVPARVAVVATCRGTSCPTRRMARSASKRRTIRLKRFERSLRAGTRLTVKVTRARRIGKWSTIVIRRGAAPRRSDLCAYPGAGAPAACPR